MRTPASRRSSKARAAAVRNRRCRMRRSCGPPRSASDRRGDAGAVCYSQLAMPALIAVAGLLAIALAGVIRAGRRRRLLDLQRSWGAPIARERRLDTIAASHAARRAAFDTGALDDRTWTDLDLDDVFVAIDRTTSTLGQHALYHRLRMAPAG